MGCFRIIDEILVWADASNNTRAKIIENIAARKAMKAI
jgi:predicted Fe-S protein YdhL (DUF1289 family)